MITMIITIQTSHLLNLLFYQKVPTMEKKYIRERLMPLRTHCLERIPQPRHLSHPVHMTNSLGSNQQD